MRHFLFLQGPHGSFFRQLGLELVERGHTVQRVNLCGGDWLDWSSPYACCYHGHSNAWSSWIGQLMNEKHITDLLVFGDWRSLHHEAIIIAKLKGIQVWVFEEGYLRPSYVTMEAGGVNGKSTLLEHGETLQCMAQKILDDGFIPSVPKTLSSAPATRMKLAFNYGAVELLARPFFPWYQTHRPNGILKELAGWIPRLLGRYLQRRNAINTMRKVYHAHKPYFLFPLQLDSDAQVRRYSPFSGMKEAIVHVIASFARSAQKDTMLVIRNHPLDNGLINYQRFIQNFAESIGLGNRIYFVETGNANLMLKKCEALIVLNSTIGITALQEGIPVYCVGTSIYAMPGLAVNKTVQRLDDFWNKPVPPCAKSVHDFEIILKKHALINGYFYASAGVQLCITHCCERFELT